MTKLIIRRYPHTQPMISSALGIMGFVASGFAQYETPTIIPEAVALETPEPIIVEAPVKIPEPKLVDMSGLKNKKVNGLFQDYLGTINEENEKQLPIALPTEANVDFSKTLENMWDKKLKRKKVSGATRKNASLIVERYKSEDPGLMTVDAFISEANESAQKAKASIKWDSWCSARKLKDFQCSALKKTSMKIQGKHLIAYGMTELFPGRDGSFNKATLDILLQHGGANYIQSIPAMYDQYLSFGFYQFTSYAVRHDSEVEGASRVSIHSNLKIPGSVVGLKGSDHHVAAYYFAVYNLSSLIKKLNEKEAKSLSSCSMLGTTQFIATAHHLPAPSVKAAKKWVYNHCKEDYSNFVKGSLRDYALKTKANLGVL